MTCYNLFPITLNFFHNFDIILLIFFALETVEKLCSLSLLATKALATKKNLKKAEKNLFCAFQIIRLLFLIDL